MLVLLLCIHYRRTERIEQGGFAVRHRSGNIQAAKSDCTFIDEKLPRSGAHQLAFDTLTAGIEQKENSPSV